MTSTTEREKPALTILAGDRRARIVGTEGGIVFVREEIGPAEGRFGAKLLMTDGPVGAALMCVAERVRGDGRDGVLGYRVVAPANASQVLAGMAGEEGRQRFRHALALEKLPSRRAPRAVAGRRRLRRINLGFVAAAVVLAGVVGFELNERLYAFDAEIARVAAGGEVVKAEKGGRIVFLTDKPTVLAGEPVFGVQTGTGYELASAAPIGGTVSQKLVRNGEKVRPGQPVLVVTPPESAPFVIADVRTADAVRVARGVNARLRFADGSEETVALAADDIQPVSEATATSRVHVRIETARDLTDAIGQSVAVRFEVAGGAIAAPLPDAPVRTADAGKADGRPASKSDRLP